MPPSAWETGLDPCPQGSTTALLRRPACPRKNALECWVESRLVTLSGPAAGEQVLSQGWLLLYLESITSTINLSILGDLLQVTARLGPLPTTATGPEDVLSGCYSNQSLCRRRQIGRQESTRNCATALTHPTVRGLGSLSCFHATYPRLTDSNRLS